MKRFIALVLCVLMLWGCASPELHTQQFTTIFAMDTVMSFDLWGVDAKDAAAAIAARIAELELEWSATDQNSILGRLNAGAEVTLSLPLAWLYYILPRF